MRNTLRFALGNIGSAESKEVEKAELGLAERYVMHRTWELEKTALEGYDAFNFAKGTSLLSPSLLPLNLDLTLASGKRADDVHDDDALGALFRYHQGRAVRFRSKQSRETESGNGVSICPENAYARVCARYAVLGRRSALARQPRSLPAPIPFLIFFR